MCHHTPSETSYTDKNNCHVGQMCRRKKKNSDECAGHFIWEAQKGPIQQQTITWYVDTKEPGHVMRKKARSQWEHQTWPKKI